MSSPVRDPTHALRQDEDDPMEGSEGEGDPIAASDDSSEEPEEDEEEERRIREGFIVDEDEDEEADDDDDEERRRRRKRRKRRHRREREEEEDGLEEDDLDLLEENTGGKFKRGRLTRIRRRQDSPPVPSSSKRKAVVESSDDDLDNDDSLPAVRDIQSIWDDANAGRDDEDDVDMDDMDNFIEYEDEDEQGGAMDETEREARRKERRRLEKARRKAMGSHPELAGIDANAWEEIHEIFGDGHKYDWALGDEDEGAQETETTKTDMRYQDVFEPSEIQARMLTEDDDLIRAQDIPERMQLATSSLSPSSTLSISQDLAEKDLNDAASWVITRLSPRKERDFFRSDGAYHAYLPDLVDAVTSALRYIFVQHLEVPYIASFKRDYISSFDPNNPRAQVELLSLEDLWRVYAVGQKYLSLVERRVALDAFFGRLGVEDEYYQNEIRTRIDSAEMAADATEWLGMKHRDDKKNRIEMHFHDDDQAQDAPKHKMPSRVSAYELAKKTIVAKLAEGFGIAPHEVVMNFMADLRTNFVDDVDIGPLAYADQFVDPDVSRAQTAEELLARARMIVATELGKDPLLRHEIRNAFKTDGVVSVSPTERGLSKIDEQHPYFNFKYLLDKPASELLHSPQFPNILAAEASHLVTVTIGLRPDARARFERRLNEAFTSDSRNETAQEWNRERALVVQETLEQHLLPVGVKWARAWIRDEAEDFLAKQCAQNLRQRIDVAPFTTPSMKRGDTPAVMALSWGKGEPRKDPIAIVFLDDAGRLREHTTINNLVDQDHKDEFMDIVKRRRPDVIVLGGFSIATTKLSQQLKEVLGHKPDNGPDAGGAGGGWGDPQPSSNEDRIDIPVHYVHDDVARIYQHSARAAEEFSALSPLSKYCVGLARWTQSPLNEFAALGSDITVVSFDDEYQQLVPKEKLLTALERVLVDVVNKVGVDINRSITDSYYQRLLPFVCGLGPRKAQALVKRIASLGGSLVNREQFISQSLLTTQIFLNAAGFLRIMQDTEPKPAKHRHAEETDNVADPLDNMRIHPEDYELARKMASDALELDEEDIHGEHPSHVVSLIIADPDNVRKLDELNLDEFAVSMYVSNKDRKRHILTVIREELVKPFGERREPFVLPNDWEVLTMLTGESRRTLRTGFIVSVQVVRDIPVPSKDSKSTPRAVIVRMDSGIEGKIEPGSLTETGREPWQIVKRGQSLPVVIAKVVLNLPADSFSVEFSSLESDIAAGDSQYRRVKQDDCWDHDQYQRQKDMLARKKRAEVDKTRRVVKHPNFHNFTSAQAEAFLETQQRGDVVIRPSSKGIDHLAVTWKVDDKLYQHIDVVEPNADPNGQSVGPKLIVDGTHNFTDLDELIVNHVSAMARKVEELMAHEKYKQGSEDELHLFLRNFVAANPAKSAYGFTLNRKRPGHFNLCYLANKNSTVQTWPVRVTPEAFYLFDTPAAGVPELCDAFKVRQKSMSLNAGLPGGGKTPYGSRTPARTPAPGHSTPGHMSVRQVPGRTPNPNAYGGAGAPPPAAGGFAPSNPPYGGMSSYGATPAAALPFGGGFSTPSFRPPPPAGFGQPGAPPAGGPPGVHPSRAAMIQSNWQGYS